MVSVNQQTLHRNSSKLFGHTRRVFTVLGISVGIYIMGSVTRLGSGTSSSFTEEASQKTTTKAEDRQLRTERVHRPNRPQSIQVVFDESKWAVDPKNAAAAAAAESAKPKNKEQQQQRQEGSVACSYDSLKDLTTNELHPNKGERHMIDPPYGGKVSLVCCNTTAGKLNIVAHHKWAPLGAERFMDMVTSGYFDSGVPFMRCIEGFLCQFGLNADNAKKNEFGTSIEDDPNWLPEGPPGRKNEQGVKRFAQGYLAYAGAGNKTRSNQLIISLKANGPLAGGSPWEVPWGEIVHSESFETLGRIYTGYGENGPPQGLLGRNGMTKEMREKWPELDYINSCHLVDEKVLPDEEPPQTKEEKS